MLEVVNKRAIQTLMIEETMDHSPCLYMSSINLVFSVVLNPQLIGFLGSFLKSFFGQELFISHGESFPPVAYCLHALSWNMNLFPSRNNDIHRSSLCLQLEYDRFRLKS